MPRAFTVFVCSSFGDLSEERRAVVAAIQDLHLAHEAMEFFGAREGAPIETCLAQVRRSDALVVIVGHRYGSLVPDRSVSFSQAEYEEATALGKPCLVYLRDPTIPVLIKDVERDARKIELLEQWKATLQQRHTVAMFQDHSDLAARVSSDLDRTMRSLAGTRTAQISINPQHARRDFHGAAIKAIDIAIDAGVREADLLQALRGLVGDLARNTLPHPLSVVFSYSGVDTKFVHAIAERLRAHNIDVWIDTRHVPNSDKWQGELEKALASADCFVFFLSTAFLESPWTAMELETILAKRLDQPLRTVLLPVQLERVDPPPLLRTYKYLDMTDRSVELGADRLFTAIKTSQDRASHLPRDNRARGDA